MKYMMTPWQVTCIDEKGAPRFFDVDKSTGVRSGDAAIAYVQSLLKAEGQSDRYFGFKVMRHGWPVGENAENAESSFDGVTYLRCVTCGAYVVEGEAQAHRGCSAPEE